MNAKILERTPRMKMMKVTTRFGDTSSSTTKLGSSVRSFFILAQDSSGGRVNLNHQELGENQLYFSILSQDFGSVRLIKSYRKELLRIP